MYNIQKHRFICGETGSGKTFFASWEYEKIPVLAIFVNTSHEVQPEQKSSIIVHNYEDLIEAYNEKHRKICWSPSVEKDIEKEDVELLCETLIKMGAIINKNRKHPFIWCYLYIDELREYSSKFQPSKKIDRIWKRGRRYGIVGVAIDQRPADVSHAVLTQSQTHIIFYMGTYERKYFDTYRIPIFEQDYIDWLEQDYHFLVYTKGEMIKAKPIKP